MNALRKDEGRSYCARLSATILSCLVEIVENKDLSPFPRRIDAGLDVFEEIWWQLIRVIRDGSDAAI